MARLQKLPTEILLLLFLGCSPNSAAKKTKPHFFGDWFSAKSGHPCRKARKTDLILKKVIPFGKSTMLFLLACGNSLTVGHRQQKSKYTQQERWVRWKKVPKFLVSFGRINCSTYSHQVKATVNPNVDLFFMAGVGPRHPAAKKPPFDTIGLATKTKIITTTVYSTVTAEPKFATAVIPPPVIKTVYKTVTVPMWVKRRIYLNPLYTEHMGTFKCISNAEELFLRIACHRGQL